MKLLITLILLAFPALAQQSPCQNPSGDRPGTMVSASIFYVCIGGAWVPISTGTGWVDDGITLTTARTVNINSMLVVPITVSTAGPVSVLTWGFYLNNAAGALTYTLPPITAKTVGAQYCFRNSTTKTGAITITAPASTYIDKDGANGTVAGTLVSGGAVGDSACVVAISTTQYAAYAGVGTWTNN